MNYDWGRKWFHITTTEVFGNRRLHMITILDKYLLSTNLTFLVIHVKITKSHCGLCPLLYDRLWCNGDVCSYYNLYTHDDVIIWKHFPRYWPFVRRIHRTPVNSPHKCKWSGALMFSLICALTSNWTNNDAGDLRRYCAHYHVIIMSIVGAVKEQQVTTP